MFLKRTAVMFTVFVTLCLVFFAAFNIKTISFGFTSDTGSSWTRLGGYHSKQGTKLGSAHVNNTKFRNLRWHRGKSGKQGDNLSNIIEEYLAKHRNLDSEYETSSSEETTGNTAKDVTTKLTFDPHEIVTCKETAYVQCRKPSTDSRVNTAYPKRVFNVAMLRRPGWVTVNYYDFNRCEYKMCRFVDEDVTEQTDVVVLYSVDLNENYAPPKRWPHQLYVATTWESPPHTRASFIADADSRWSSYFNLTMTYRTDSDIFVPYGKLRFDPKLPQNRPNYYEIAKKKRKTVAWLVSHCGTPSKREQYAKEMKEYVDVDVYGGCGEPCKDCAEKIFSDYKFYLSFENSLCTEYVTEKFFDYYKRDSYIIPVVRGSAEYDKIFPESTFINTAHFKSPKELGRYLKDLSSDLGRYSQLLERKDLYMKTSFQLLDHPCEICKYMHTHPQPASQIHDLKKWWADDHCQSPTDI